MANMKVGTRLGLGFSAVLVVMLIIMGFAYFNLTRLGQANFMNIHTYQVIGEGNGMLVNMINMETGIRGYVVSGNEAFLDPYKKGKENFITHFNKAKSLTSDNPGQQDRLAKILELHKEFSGVGESLITLRKESVEGKRKLESVISVFNEARDKKSMDAFRAMVAEFEQTESVLLGSRSKEAASMESTTKMTMILGGIFGIILAFLIGFLIVRNLMKQLGGEPDYAAGEVKAIASGDLTRSLEVRPGDTASLMYSLKTMQDALKSLISNVKGAVDSINTGASEISTGNRDLSQRTEEQASSLEETASSMEELTSTVKQNAENSKQANQLAKGASDIAVKGGDVVGKVVTTMASINDSSKKIVDIISVIEGIAFQTNILALNAAVEAARAGEQGRGFAVVASEVRSLAQRSAAAAKEIKTLIGDSVSKVEDGTVLVDQAGKTMEEIVSAVKRVTDIMAEISAASAEQSSGIEQVNQAITQMDNVTQQNAALVEEAAAAAESLEEEAQNLAQSVSVFRLDTSSSSRAASTRLAVHHETQAPAAPAHKAARQTVPRKAAGKPKALPAAKEEDEEWKEF